MDTAALETKLKKLGSSLNALSAAGHADKLITIIHRPGWTTLPESLLVNALIDNFQHQLDGAQKGYNDLLTAAGHIGK
jgi:hypothetical protein